MGVQFNGLLDSTTKSEQTDRSGQQAADKNHGGDVHVLGGHWIGPSIPFGPIVHRWVELCPGRHNQSVRHLTPNNFFRPLFGARSRAIRRRMSGVGGTAGVPGRAPVLRLLANTRHSRHNQSALISGCFSRIELACREYPGQLCASPPVRGSPCHPAYSTSRHFPRTIPQTWDCLPKGFPLPTALFRPLPKRRNWRPTNCDTRINRAN